MSVPEFSVQLKQSLISSIPYAWQEKQWEQLREQKSTAALAHAYLIYGEAGIGKSLFAEALAQSILCLTPTSTGACGGCSMCKLAASGSLPDLLVVEPMDGSRDIKIDQIRKVSDFMAKSSHSGRGKVVVVHSAHCLNIAAANALLKTLEEPSQASYLLLVSELPGALSATIRSRCQRVKMNQPTKALGAQWLDLHLAADPSLDQAKSSFSTQPLLAFDSTRFLDPQMTRAFLAGLGDVLVDPSSLRLLVAQAIKLGDMATIGYLLQVSTILIKYLLTNCKEDLSEPELERVGELLTNSGLERSAAGKALLVFQQEIQIARRQFLGTSNPNPQLVLESLLWKWSQLLH